MNRPGLLHTTVPTRFHYHVPSLEEAHVLVRTSLEEGIPIDRVACRAIFPHGKPKFYGDWPRPAIDAWDGILAVYEVQRSTFNRTPAPVKRAGTQGGRPTHHPDITIAQAWSAVLASAAMIECDQRLAWSDVSHRLGISSRAAMYQLMGRLGFAFQGRYARRRLMIAPCIRCGARLPVAELDKSHTCPECLNSPTEQAA